MYAPIVPVVPMQPIDAWYVPDTTQRHPLGMLIAAIDPYWGYGEFVYGKSAAALNFANLVAMTATLGNFDKVASTAGLGFPVLSAMNEMAISTYGWFLKAGVGVFKSSATVAAAANIAVVSAGVLGAVANGKQVLNYNQLASATGTKTFANTQTQNGSAKLFMPGGYGGIFLGGALSGTGIPASTVVAKLDPDGCTVYTGSAIGTVGDKNSTATGAVTVTQTNTGYSVAHVDSPFMQGQVA